VLTTGARVGRCGRAGARGDVGGGRAGEGEFARGRRMDGGAMAERWWSDGGLTLMRVVGA